MQSYSAPLNDMKFIIEDFLKMMMTRTTKKTDMLSFNIQSTMSESTMDGYMRVKLFKKLDGGIFQRKIWWAMQP